MNQPTEKPNTMKNETDFMRSILPSHYTCTPLKNGINCKSRNGIDENDPEHWEYIVLAIKQKFAKRFMEIYHNTCYNHVNFTVYIKP